VELNASLGDEDIVLGLDVAVVVEVDLALEHGGVGIVADTEEHEADRQGPALASVAIHQLEALEVFFFDAKNFFHDGVVDELDLRVRDGALQHDAAGPEVFAAIDDRDLGGEAREEKGFFHGGVAAADDGDLFAGGEEAVAGGAGADAEADECLLGRQAQPTCRSAGGDDERARLDDFLADGQLERRLGEIGRGEVRHAQFGAEASSLLLHVLDELGSLHAVGPAGKVFNQRGDRKLATGFVAFEDEGLQVRASSVDGCGEARAAGAEDDSVAYGSFGHTSLIVLGAERVQGWKERTGNS